MALDGRCRSLIAGLGSIGELEHTGSLYWHITRTQDPAEANLDAENMSFRQNIEVMLSAPAHKKRKLQSGAWEPSDLPTIPYLTNKKAIPKHTKLCLWSAEKGKAK